MEKSHGIFFGMNGELTEGYIVYLISLRNSVHLYIKGVHFTNFAFQSPNREIFSRSGENFLLIGRNPPIGRKVPDRDPSRTGSGEGSNQVTGVAVGMLRKSHIIAQLPIIKELLKNYQIIIKELFENYQRIIREFSENIHGIIRVL